MQFVEKTCFFFLVLTEKLDFAILDGKCDFDIGKNVILQFCGKTIFCGFEGNIVSRFQWEN